MKKIKIFTIILFFCSAAAFAGCKLYERVVTDHQPPVISGGEETLLFRKTGDACCTS